NTCAGVDTGYKDESIVVQAQASSRPLCAVTPIVSSALMGEGKLSSKILNSQNLTREILPRHHSDQLHRHLQSHPWAISCFRPNDSGSPNSFNKRGAKAQICSLLLPNLMSRKSME
ncbi:hypothetical protein BDP27DRAFT_1517553, partial [Rhodocollybia butyracea]